VTETQSHCLAYVFSKDWEYQTMKLLKLAVATAVAAVLLGGQAFAQQLRQPASVEKTAFTYDYYSQPQVTPSPSDVPIVPSTGDCAAKSAACGTDSACDGGCNDGCGCYRFGDRLGDLLPCRKCCDEPWTLFPNTNCRGIKAYGWLAQGATTNRYNPVNPAAGLGNLPMTFNYRNDEYQLNQLYGIIERETDTGGCGWDFGGRVDVLYGEDYIFTQAAGLETRPNFANHWNTAAGGGGILGTGRLGIAMPQVYGEVAYNDIKVKLGHFYTVMGYESVMAPSNFFYSHAYTMQWGEPFTHTGAIATWQYNDQWTFIGGIVNGWDKFDAVTDRAAGIGGFAWTSSDEDTSVAFSLISGDEDGVAPPIIGRRDFYSLVISHQFNDRLQYVFQHDSGRQKNGRTNGSAHWYGINQYLFYTINDCWKAGVRAEWFNDQNGTRVLFPGTIVGPPGYAGHYYELAAGLNWTPHANVILRPEIRWDGFDPHAAAMNLSTGPFVNGTRRDQATAAVDLILRY
jgi:hypothetical protein